MTASSMLGWLLVEVLCYYGAFYILHLQSSAAAWELLSLASYKYVGCAQCRRGARDTGRMNVTAVLALISGSMLVYHVALIETAAALAWFMVARRQVPPSVISPGPLTEDDGVCALRQRRPPQGACVAGRHAAQHAQRRINFLFIIAVIQIAFMYIFTLKLVV